MSLTVVCAWCGKFLRIVDCKESGISHGICPACFAVQMAEVKANKNTGEQYAGK
jgi:phage FluMu protein Com